MMAYATLMTLPVVLLFFFARKTFLRGISLGGTTHA
jgi:ABC-type glycerol-3-phosphate transport system permease component